MYEMICVVISGLTFVWVLSVRSWKSMALIEVSLEDLPVRAALGQSCLATKISAPGPSLLGGSATPPRCSAWCFFTKMGDAGVDRRRSARLGPRGVEPWWRSNVRYQPTDGRDRGRRAPSPQTRRGAGEPAT